MDLFNDLNAKQEIFGWKHGEFSSYLANIGRLKGGFRQWKRRLTGTMYRSGSCDWGSNVINS